MKRQGLYPIIAFGAILFYMTVVFVMVTYALMIRLVPSRVKSRP